MKQKQLVSGKKAVAQTVVSAVLLGVSFCLNRFVGYFPEPLLARWRSLSLAYSDFASQMTGHIPFSFSELAFYALILALLTALATAISSVVTFREGHRVASFFSGLLLSASALILAYYLFFGLWFQFDSPVLPEPKRVSPTVDLLYAASEDMQQKANAAARAIPRKSDGAPAFGDFAALADAVCARYGGRLEALTGGRRDIAPPKEVLWSTGLSKLGITGVYIPFTGECNINAAVPVVTVPFTMAHELSHRYGTAREDECNYIAIDLLLDGDSEQAYSASFMGYVYLTNALYRADPALWQKLKETEDPLLSSDLAAHSAYWKAYEGRSREVASAINDAQLKINGQKDGEQSYGRVTDLLIARFVAESE